MAVRVLVAEDDLNAHRVIRDILEISLKDVKIDRAMDHERVLAKIREAESRYDLILYDLHFDEPLGKDALLAVRRELPEVDKSIVILNASAEEIAGSEAAKGLPYITKPFSLDNFSEVVKRVCAKSS